MTGITAHLTGRLGRDAEHRLVKGGALPMTALAVAVTERAKDATTWCRVVTFGDLAEATRTWLKGETVTVEGKLELQRWTTSEGAERSGLSLVAISARLGSHRPTIGTPKPAGPKRRPKPKATTHRTAGIDPDLNDDIADLM
jgi:single stranded DNA-binding protein